MKTLYKPALIVGNFDKGRIKKVKARKIILPSLPKTILFVHKEYGYYSITEPKTGAKIATNKRLTDAITEAERKIRLLPVKYKSFDDFVNEYTFKHNLYQYNVNLKIFAQ